MKNWIRKIIRKYVRFFMEIVLSEDYAIKDSIQDVKRMDGELKAASGDIKAVQNEIKAMHGIVEAMDRFDHVMSICEVSDLTWEEAIKQYARCKEQRLDINDFISFHAWDIEDDEIDELKKVIRLCKLKEQWAHNYYVDMAYEKTGIDKKELYDKLLAAEAKGYTGPEFIQKSYFFWDLPVLQTIPYNNRAIKPEENKKAREMILADTGWTYGKYLMEFKKAHCICDCMETEFYMYGIYKSDYFEATKYCTGYLGADIFSRYCDFTGPHRFFGDKSMFLEAFSDFVNRKWFATKGLDFETFKNKIEGLDALIYKPLASNQGKGIRKFELQGGNAQEIYDEIMLLGPGIVEEFIKQHPLLDAVCSTSVNSIRVMTFAHEDEVEVLAATLRAGVGAITDNISQDGLSAGIDIDTGIVCTHGTNKMGDVYEEHPVSGFRFKGMQIPHWEEIIRTCKEAARVIPAMKYIGWDISVTADDRIEIIEGNHGPGMNLMQNSLAICNQEGIRSRFEKFLWFEGSEQPYYLKAVRESGMDYDEMSRIFQRLGQKGISAAQICNNKLYRKEPPVFTGSQRKEAAEHAGYHIDEETLAAAREKYERKKPSCYEKDVITLQNIDEIKAPRYVLGQDGIYHKKSKKQADTGKATIMFTGDNLCIANQIRAALADRASYDFKDSYFFVKKLFAKADCVVGNLETVLADSKAYISEQDKTDGKTNCNAPSTFLDAIRYAGFDLMACSNNHNCDAGVDGILETIAHLDQYHLMHTGLFTGDEDRRYVIVEINGIRVGFLSYSTTFNLRENGLTEEGQDVLLNSYSKERVSADAAQARKAGAEYIIAYNHWGIEGDHDPSEEQRLQAQEMADAGVDYIIGSHPHVLQPYDVIRSADGRDVPVVFSMGNFVSGFGYFRFGHVRDSIILRIRLTRDPDGSVRLADDHYVPVYVYDKFGRDQRRYVAVPLTSRYLSPNTRALFSEVYSRITAAMGDKIKVEAPLDLSGSTNPK